MRPKENQNKDYVNAEVVDIGNECEHVYENESIDIGTYVYEEKSKKPCTKVVSIPKQKPGHQRGQEGLYDEIDYQLDPQTKDAKSIRNNDTVPKGSTKTDEKSKKKKMIIGFVIGGLLIGAIVIGLVFALSG